MSATYVATSHPGEAYHNTLVLGDLTIVIPLEEDLDGDPDTLDCVRLKHRDGLYEAVLTEGDVGVEPDGDNPLNRYHFPAVLPGYYSVEVKVGNDWHAVVRDLHITRSGAFFGDTSLVGPADGSEMGSPESNPAADLAEADEPDCGCC